MPDAAAPSALSLVPALVTIALALLTRQVLVSLLAGILAASVVVVAQAGAWSDPAAWSAANPLTRFLLPSLGSERYAQILLVYLWCLGGLLGVWERTGASDHFARRIGARIARDRRSSLFFAWLLGIVFHQGGTPSTVLAGSTAKPVADRYGVSHEELSYVVDSTSSPVATILPFNAWPAYVGGVVAGTIPALLPDEAAGVSFFYSSLKFNFYGVFAVLTTLLFTLGLLPWIGRRMRAARQRAIDTGQLDGDDAVPMLPPTAPTDERDVRYRPHLVDFMLPLGLLIGIAVGSYWITGSTWMNEAFSLAALCGALVAWSRGMRLDSVVAGFVVGCQKMTLGAIVLGLAVTLGDVSKELDAGGFVVAQVGSAIVPVVLPVLLMGLCMAIAFATGTSWGTYAVVFPLAMPLAWSLLPDPLFLQICFGAVLGGSVFGDQCSPISDTTVLSSMFTGCDHVDHVWTQLPLALAAAAAAGIASTLAVVLLL